MRRAGLISNKVIILVLLSGFFNLLSFTFDQLVVQSELKTRDLDRKMVINKNNIDNLLIKIDTLGDLSNDAAASGLHFHNYFEIVLKNAEFFNSEIRKNEQVSKKILSKKQFEILGLDFTKKYSTMISDFNKKILETEKIFVSIEPKVAEYLSLEDILIPEENTNDYIFRLNKNVDKKKVDDQNYEIYSLIYDKINELSWIDTLANYYIDIAEESYVNEFADFLNLVDKYSKQQNNINYFILLSIISQILGIFFILLLFKLIISKNKI